METANPLSQPPPLLLEAAGIRRFGWQAAVGVFLGVATMFAGSRIVQQGPQLLLPGGVVSLAGWAIVLWGSVNYMRWKGYSGWFGLFGYLLLPGLIVLLCFPNRRHRASLGMDQTETNAPSGAVSDKDLQPGYRFLLILAPLGLVCALLVGFVRYVRADASAAEWIRVAPPGLGYEALMPGVPRFERKVQEVPGGQVEVHKATVVRSKGAMLMIVSLSMPEDAARLLGGPDKLLGVGRQDVLAAARGTIQSERQLVMKGRAGLELDVLRDGGANVKARIWATESRIYELTAYGSQLRLTSDDVRKFFESFRLTDKPIAEP
jgi:hypothetical protein